MSTAQSADLIWLIMAIVLVMAGLLSRRWSLRSALGMVMGWVLIFAIVLAIFSYRNELGMVAQHVKQEVTGANQQKIVGDRIEIAKGLDGHFWADAEVNGTTMRFLIDSGATITALSQDAAMKTGLNVDQGFPVILTTANGRIEAHRSNIATLSLGTMRASDLPVLVSAAFGDVNALGMNFLSRLKSWRVEGDKMILEPA